jgi:acyl carrier protein
MKEVMKFDFSKLDRNKKIEEIDEWDSFNNLMLISKYQEVFNIEFTTEEVSNTKTIQDLLDLMERKTTA